MSEVTGRSAINLMLLSLAKLIMKKHLFTALVVLSPLTTFAQDQSASEWKTLKDAAYQIQYPSSWQLDQSASMQTSFVLYGRQLAEGKFRENVNLIMQDISGYNLDLAGYAKLSEDQINIAMANGKILESKQVTVSGITHHMIIYQGDFNQYKLKWKQYYWIVQNKAYVLTFTATQETFEEFLPTADRILNSFSITK